MRISVDVRVVAFFVLATLASQAFMVLEIQKGNGKAKARIAVSPAVVVLPASNLTHLACVITPALAMPCIKEQQPVKVETPAATLSPLPGLAADRQQWWKAAAYWRGKRVNPTFTDGWHSQTGQDKTISEIFENRAGFFVDLASNNAVEISNTFALENRFGWDGLCIEANPIYWPDLLDRRCKLIMAVVGQSDNDKVNFNFRGQGGKSGIIGAQFDNEKPRAGVGPHGMQRVDAFHSVSLASILHDAAAPQVIDYLSLDIEGAELFVMTNFPWDKYTFLTLTVERPKKLREVLEANKYVYVKEHGEHGDELYFHKDMPNFDALFAKYKGPRKTLQETIDFVEPHLSKNK